MMHTTDHAHLTGHTLVQTMSAQLMRLLALLCAPFLLCSCFYAPGNFTSTLDVRSDGRFTFTYIGEVLTAGLDNIMRNTKPPAGEGEDEGGPTNPSGHGDAASIAERDATLSAIAVQLSGERGMRSARYVGNNKFIIDYNITGTLDHGFSFPMNLDAQMLLPFVAIELRGADRVRIKAPGFAGDMDMAGMSGALSSVSGNAHGGLDALVQSRRGSFILTTDARIISQNEETGAQPIANGQRIVWTITPISKDAPAAVLQLAPRP